MQARDVEHAAEIFGTSERVVSTVLQGFYQSHQATAASVQVNNLHLLRGMIGRPGAGILQMNGQPTAQNNRETGVDGDLSGFRNWENEAHVRELADLWDVDPDVIPHWAPPTHAMQIFRYVEQGSIGFLWIAGTNPAVSLPELRRAKRRARQRRRLRRGERRLPHRDRSARRRRAAQCAVGREDRHLHQRRPHRAPGRAGRRPAGGGPQRPGDLGRLRTTDGFHATAVAGRSPAGTLRRRPSTRGASAPAAAPATTRA